MRNEPTETSLPPKYLQRLLADPIAAAKVHGTTSYINWWHDTWCPKLKGGECSCESDFEILQLDKLGQLSVVYRSIASECSSSGSHGVPPGSGLSSASLHWAEATPSKPHTNGPGRPRRDPGYPSPTATVAASPTPLGAAWLPSRLNTVHLDTPPAAPPRKPRSASPRKVHSILASARQSAPAYHHHLVLSLHLLRTPAYS